MSAIILRPARGEIDLEETRRLFLEYAESLGFSLCFQGFDQELAALPGRYAPPSGEILLALRSDELPSSEEDATRAVGVIALRGLDAETCEMKRLYVQPGIRGHALGRRLATALVERAREMGYRRMRLDTVESMTAAIALYLSLGFREIEPYYDNPLPGVRYFELDLG
jgi:putative acetyltransferase